MVEHNLILQEQENLLTIFQELFFKSAVDFVSLIQKNK